MTREEAKTRLIAMKAKFEILLSMRGLEMSDVFDVAIEALSAEPCEDCVSRHEVMCAIGSTSLHYELARRLRKLPPVTPKQKMGYWIIKSDSNPKCSECGKEPYYSNTIYNYKFCPYCGQPKMAESEKQ